MDLDAFKDEHLGKRCQAVLKQLSEATAESMPPPPRRQSWLPTAPPPKSRRRILSGGSFPTSSAQACVQVVSFAPGWPG